MEMLSGFELIEEKYIPEISTKGRLFRHAKTGAQLLSLENEDENKVFGVTFRTPPEDSTGIAHIMEHAVLCGSRKYPVKEPFVELMKGSLNTFLNAFTYPDKTCYPVASQNLQDFYNLIDVYLDAVFYPLITPFTFQQEAWHYELEGLDDTLKFKGVVYNEMKGAYSSPDSLITRKSQQYLFPDNVYRFDSGGDPGFIPDLTYESFQEFHHKYYHPSNAYLYFYGDDDPEERLRLIDEYLKDFTLQEPGSSVDVQPYTEKQPRLVIPYDSSGSEGENKLFITLNWLLPESVEPETALRFSILTEILIGSPASPLRKALIDSGLGEDLVGVGLDTDLRQMYYSTGLKGVSQEHLDRVEPLIFETLEKLIEEGIDPETVAAALNTVEFRLRENNTGRFPQGLLLMIRALKSWLYNGDPLAAIAFETSLEEVKKPVSEGISVFEQMIKDHFLENLHRTTVILRPDPEEGERQRNLEQERLKRARQEMSDEEIQAIIANTEELKRRQESPDPAEALATIPTLELSDLDPEIKVVPMEVIEKDHSKVLFHDLFTNGIVYLDAGLDLKVLPPDLLPYVPLYGRALLEMGTEKEDFVKLSQRIGRSTGGMYTTTFTSMIQGGDLPAAWMFLRGKSTLDRSSNLLAIFQDVLFQVKFDNYERFRQIVLEEKAGLEQQLVPMGHRVINRRLRSYFNQADWAAEQMSGINYLFFLRRLAESLDKDWSAVLQKLESIHNLLLNRRSMVFNVTLDENVWQKVEPELQDFIQSLPINSIHMQEWRTLSQRHFDRNGRIEGLTIPAQVNYVGKGSDLYRLGYEYDGSMAVIINYLRATWLWEKVRVQGGAYGGMGAFDHRSGVLSFLSYRDPNLLDTLEIYDQTGRFLGQLDLSQEELNKSIIGAIGAMDAFQLPDAKGYAAMLRYLAGDSDEQRQERRDQIFSTTAEDFHALGEFLDRMAQDSRVVVLGPDDSAEKLKSEWAGSVEVLKVL